MTPKWCSVCANGDADTLHDCPLDTSPPYVEPTPHQPKEDQTMTPPTVRPLLFQQSSDDEFLMRVDPGTGQGWGARIRLYGPHSVRGCGSVATGTPMQIILRVEELSLLRDWLSAEIERRAQEGGK